MKKLVLYEITVTIITLMILWFANYKTYYGKVISSVYINDKPTITVQSTDNDIVRCIPNNAGCTVGDIVTVNKTVFGYSAMLR